MQNTFLRAPRDHVAIVSQEFPWIDWILDGFKTIESRFYVNKVAPWNQIFKNDIIYFKESGGFVRAKAIVSEVHQFENLDEIMFTSIIDRFGDDIYLQDIDYKHYKKKRYVILIELNDVEEIEPFVIDKTGFGSAAAWMVVNDIHILARKPE